MQYDLIETACSDWNSDLKKQRNFVITHCRMLLDKLNANRKNTKHSFCIYPLTEYEESKVYEALFAVGPDDSGSDGFRLIYKYNHGDFLCEINFTFEIKFNFKVKFYICKINDIGRQFEIDSYADNNFLIDEIIEVISNKIISGLVKMKSNQSDSEIGFHAIDLNQL